MTENTSYKLTLLLRRRPDIPSDAFADAWLELDRRHPVVTTGLVRYVFNRALPGLPPIAGAAAAPYDAVIETWWTRKSDAADWVVSHAFEDEWLAPRRELLAERPAAVAGEPILLWERAMTDDMSPVTVIVLPVARRSLRFDEFVDHWTGAHAQLALAGRETKSRLVRLEDTPAPVPPPSRFLRTRYDGVGAITFASAEALAAEFGSDHRDDVAPDEIRFTDATVSCAFVGTRIDLT